MVTARSLVELDRVDHAREVLLHGGWVQSLAERLNELSDLMFRLGDADGAQRIGDAAALLEQEADYQAEASLAGEAAEAVPTETLAFLYLSQGHEDRAVDIYRKILDADPDNEAVRIKLSSLRPGEFDYISPIAESLEMPSAPAIPIETPPAEMEIPWASVEDEDRLIINTDELYLKTPAEMAHHFEDLPEALENTQKIADRCHVSFTFGNCTCQLSPFRAGKHLPIFWNS